MPTDLAASPYQRVLGRDLAGLHPRLRAYFSAIPLGSVGRGDGIFDVVGTPRRWLWPALWLLGRAGIVFPVWQHGVPFSVTNRPVTDAGGSPAVSAVRRFRFSGGHRDMTDLIAAPAGGLIDRLGSGGILEAAFEAGVAEGGLVLTSTKVAVRVGRLALVVPSRIAPVVRLSERFDDAADRQRIGVTIDAPLLGRLYEYRGSFTYSVDREGDS